MVLFPKEKVPYSTWYFFPLVLFPIIPPAPAPTTAPACSEHVVTYWMAFAVQRHSAPSNLFFTASAKPSSISS